MDCSPVLLVKCIDVGSSGQQQLYHLSNKSKLTVCWHQCKYLCVHLKETNLYMSTEGSMVQCSASRPVRHVDATEQRDQSLSTAYRLVASCDMEWRLPVLVPGIDIWTVLQQYCHCILDKEWEWIKVGRQRGYFIICLSVLTKYAPACAGGCVCEWLKVFAVLTVACMLTNSTDNKKQHVWTWFLGSSKSFYSFEARLYKSVNVIPAAIEVHTFLAVLLSLGKHP